MTKKNIEKLQIMAQDFLQYRYSIYCRNQRNEDFLHYQGACDMICAFGGEWKRGYTGKDNETDSLNNPENYYHIVWFPSKEKCERLNEDAWK